MDIKLQGALFTVSIISFLFIVYKVRKSKVLIDDIIIWIYISLGFLVISIFPESPRLLSKLLGFEALSNFVFFSMIGYLFIMVFMLTLKVSKLENVIKEITQINALDEHSRNDYENK